MARSPFAAARLQATAAAKQVHQDLDLPRRVTEGAGHVDVFEAIGELDIPLVFKPLTSALGLCVPAPLRGIMITTKRGLHIQRFTAAHELGHVVLDHRGSVDREIVERGPLAFSEGRDVQEVAADAFAAEFVLPRWLYRHHIRAQNWTVAHDLRIPDIIYQLSLRMGASYEATCWGLLSHQILDRGTVDNLRAVQVAKLKASLGGEFKPGSSWSDVWRLTTRDDGALLAGNPDDLLRIELEESSTGGYQWQADVLGQAGYTVLSDTSDFSRNPLLYGASAVRTLIARPPENGAGDVVLVERQAWAPAEIDAPSFALCLSLLGPEAGGLSRAGRKRLGMVP